MVSRPLMIESSFSVSEPPVIEMFSFEYRLFTTKGLPVLRTVIVSSPAWSITTSVVSVGSRPPAQFAATSQKPEVVEIQVLARVPLAKLSAFEK